MKGAWPPPCTTVRTTFYYVDSNKYWSLAESVGVAVTVATKGGQYAIFIDLKVIKQIFIIIYYTIIISNIRYYVCLFFFRISCNTT